ncbi:MAG: hypothetical protein J7K30_01280 [Deltaproteobacteria bacterium]|nr:hypothetical protein [Deltaproteobacteria bacterium]
MKKAIITFAAMATMCVASVHAQDIYVDMQVDVENSLLQDGRGVEYMLEQEPSEQHQGSEVKTPKGKSLAERIASYTDVTLTKNTPKTPASEQCFSVESDTTGYLALEGDDVVFNKGTRKYEGDGDTSSLPEKDEAERIARKHLADLDMLKGSIRSELKLAHVGGVNKATYSEDGTHRDYRKLVTVYYDRRIKDVPVVGHSRVVVTLGEYGELTGLIKKWTRAPKNLKFVATDFLSETQVRKQVKEMLARHYKKSKNKLVDSINVIDARYILYDDGTTIEPALFALGEVARYDGTSYDGDWIIPVLKNPKANYKILSDVPVTPNDESVYPSDNYEEEDDE